MSLTAWFEPTHDKTNEMACAIREDSDQPGHPPSLIRVFAVRSVGSLGPKVPSCGQQRLWSDWADAQADLESSQGTHAILICWFCHEAGSKVTIMILSFRTDGAGQTVQTQIRLLLEEQSDQGLHCLQTQIRLLLEEQSDQGLHCLQFHLHRLDSLLYSRAT